MKCWGGGAAVKCWGGCCEVLGGLLVKCWGGGAGSKAMHCKVRMATPQGQKPHNALLAVKC